MIAEQSRRRSSRYDVAFVAARIALGCYWLYEQHWKLPPDFGLHQPRGLMFAFQQSIRYPTVDLYRAFLQDVVVPHFHLFGWLLGIAEVAIGLSLVLGAFTRAGALLGVLQALNLLIAQGRTPEGPWIYVAILAANVFVLFTPSNRRFSVDNRIASRIAARTSRETLLTRVWRLASGCPTV
jgi:uncharacterized membrane protein YphA (DoxX/SURF4 family)